MILLSLCPRSVRYSSGEWSARLELALRRGRRHRLSPHQSRQSHPQASRGSKFHARELCRDSTQPRSRQVGEELTLKLGKSTALLQNLAFFPDLTDRGGNYRTNFSLGTVTKITKWLGWQTNFSDTYVTNPPAGKKQNELVLTSGPRLAFAHSKTVRDWPNQAIATQRRLRRFSPLACGLAVYRPLSTQVRFSKA